MARNRVPIYSVHGNILRYTTESQALEMLELKSAKRVSRPKAQLKIQLVHLERVDGGSPCSISFQEALANVGISDKRGEHNYVSESRKRQVQAKVNSFQAPSWLDRVVVERQVECPPTTTFTG